ncbi:centriolar and ciliogenesis-associated protein HYSL1-like [Phaenicophaeus curvirostris]|uniref:centriolar and ciliogenesis-associated protein HYSL1-like n=1 Tax=Phaenicophaeus curvirostris TaxID=33595 RepID=UPI0037F0AB0E
MCHDKLTAVYFLQDPPSLAETKEMWGPERCIWVTPAAEEQAQPNDDLYAQASLGLGVRSTLLAFPEDQRGSRRMVMKRKVLRHRPDGGVEVFDESGSSTNTRSLRQKMLHHRPSPEDSSSEGEIESSNSSHPWWPRRDSPCFLPADLGSQSSHDSHYRAAAEQPKSFIPPRFELLGRNRGKTDCVAKYFEYKRDWEKFGIPGEDRWKEVRWGIREKMLCEPELPHRPQHLPIPNNYTVPTEKKRAALCWKVRWDLARGLLPEKTTPW